MDLMNTAPADPVAETLSAVNVLSSVYCLSDLRAPWGFAVEGANVAKFHLVLEGQCWLEADGQEPVRLGQGDLVILAGGHSHVLGDVPGSDVARLEMLLADHLVDARLSYGGEGARTRLLCGGFALAGPLPRKLLGLLPPILHLDSARTDVSSWIEPVFALVRQEADQAAPGAQAIFAKLADVFLSQALRTFLTGAGQAGLFRLATARDAQIDRDRKSVV